MWNDPEVFGGFLLVQRLAESAMATVHLAVRLSDSSGRLLVLKRPPLGERPSGRAAQAILREAEVLAEVRGPGIPALEATGDIAGLPYVAIERLRGASLAKIIADLGPLPISAVRAIGKDVGRALGRLHEAGWVHRDVTPSNIFVDEAGEAYLLDFGVAARAGDERSALVAGTRGYAAPEAALPGAATQARDVYGLAVCLAEAALGRRLFDETSLVEAAGRGDAPPQAASLDARLPGLSAALRRDPSARPSGPELAASLGENVNREALAARVQEVAQKAKARELPEPSSASPKIAGPSEMAETADSKGGRLTAPTPIAPTSLMITDAPPKALAPLTPTAEMPAVAPPAGDVLPTLREMPVAAPDASREPPPVSTPRAIGTVKAPSKKVALRTWVVALIILTAASSGFLVGHFVLRGPATIVVNGTIPKRAEVYLDGNKLTIAEGVPMAVKPGSHTLTVIHKSTKREFPFSVQRGQQVVLLGQQRPNAAGDDEP